MTTAPDRAPPKILLVDDTPQNIALLEDTLSAFEADLLAATSGERALELAGRLHPDLILLDVMMPPGIDGFETCRRLKADPATADIPVIFVTARSDDVATGFAAGGADYITKPIVAGEVRARVHHQLERRGLLQSLRRLNRELEDRVRERTAELTRTNLQLRQEVRERRYMQDRLNYLASHDFVTRRREKPRPSGRGGRAQARAASHWLGGRVSCGMVDCFSIQYQSCPFEPSASRCAPHPAPRTPCAGSPGRAAGCGTGPSANSSD